MITATKVPDSKRLSTLPKLFGRQCVHIESAIFDMASNLIEGYRGGYWEFFTLDNGGFYMAPSHTELVRVQVEGNGHDDTMTADAAGIVCCLMAYSNESFRASGACQETLADQFHLLRDFAAEHPQASAIFSAID